MTTEVGISAAQLLKFSDADFEQRIADMDLKGLLDTISVLQREMTKEQENFNNLSGELGSLKKNSGQYKQVSKELAGSQSRLTVLMNRSMKCFSQQGNRPSSGSGLQRRNSAKGTKPDLAPSDGQKPKRPNSMHANPDQPLSNVQVQSTPKITTQSVVKPVNGETVSQSRPNTSSNSTKVIVSQSTNMSDAKVNGVERNNTESGYKVNVSSFVTAIESGPNDRNKSVPTKSENLPNGNIRNGSSDNLNSNTSNSVSANAQNRQLSKSTENLSGKQYTKSDIPANKLSVQPQRLSGSFNEADRKKDTAQPKEQPTKSSVPVYSNLYRTVDFDSNPERKNMLAAIKSFDNKDLKVAKKRGNVTEIKLGGSVGGGDFEKRKSEELKLSMEEPSGKSQLLNQIRSMKKTEEKENEPIVVNTSSKFTVKQKVDQSPENASIEYPQPKLKQKVDPSPEDAFEQLQQFDNLLNDDEETQGEEKETPRGENVVKKSENVVETEVGKYEDTPTAKDDDDKFVTTFSFPQMRAKDTSQTKPKQTQPEVKGKSFLLLFSGMVFMQLIMCHYGAVLSLFLINRQQIKMLICHNIIVEIKTKWTLDVRIPNK